MTYDYSKYSAYAQTDLSPDGTYLDMYVTRGVPAAASDQTITIGQKYNLRPDLLAYDLYNDSRLWWVFAERNPNTLVDPVGDFMAGTTIYLPNASSLKQSLGL